MGMHIGTKKAIIPDNLQARVNSLTDETKELALAYLVARHTPDDKEFRPAVFHVDLALNAWDQLKDRGLKFER